jgi:signal transduction histidine kinase/HPt (histidine-containing phosphotransfer) domain-containing protein/ActR/RegA family two-component response regulator
MSSLLQDFLREQGYALCQYHGGGEFSLLCTAPDWFDWIWGGADGEKKTLRLGDKSPFLENFLVAAHTFWSARKKGALTSGLWVETLRDEIGTPYEISLEATALQIGDERLLSIRNQAETAAEETRILQTARDGLLVHERLQKEIQKKEILLHCIIHDLSQPLTAMRGCFEILGQEEHTERARQVVEVGKQQSEQQEEMIREVLKAFSAELQDSIAAGTAPAALPNVLRCAEETVTAFAPMFEAKGLVLRIDARLSGHRGWAVMGESTRLKRIFSNLVENALRYAPPKTTVTIGIEEDPPYLKAYVQDEGPGLPADLKASEIFRLFAKGKVGGGKAGLGLYFCKVTVERWGGSIGCESVTPHGARFWFRLLAARNQDVTVATPASAVVSGASSEKIKQSARRKATALVGPLRILLADDDAAIRELTELLLTRQGHKVLAVPSGQEALRALEKEPFDVILLDDEMPRLSGAETAKRIRTLEKSHAGSHAKHQFILSLSGNNTEADQRRMVEAGIDACLSKPFYADELNRALAQFPFPAAKTADAKKRTGGLAVNPPGATNAALGAVDAELLQRVGGDAKLLTRIIHTFLADYPKKLAQLGSAVRRKDTAVLAATAHALKGSISIFDTGKARECAQELQDMGRQKQISGAAKTLARLEEEIANLEKKLRGYTADIKTTGSQLGKGKARGKTLETRAKH